MGRKEQFDIHRQANEVVIGALRQQAASENLSPLDRETTLLEALALAAQDLSPLDKPSRRAKEEYVALPTDNESLRERGIDFLKKFGLEVPDSHVLVANRDDFLELTITDPKKPTLFAQTTITVTRKGEQLAASLGEFLEGIGAKQYLANPSQLQELEDQGLNLDLFLDEALTKSDDTSYGIRDGYDLDVTDEVNGQTLSGSIHLMEAAGEVCTTKSMKFAQPLIALETNIRQRWPYQGATKEVFIVTDAIPQGYENVAEVMLGSTQNQIKRLEGRIDQMVTYIGKRLSKKRGIDLSLDLPIDELYMSKRTGHLLVTALAYDLPDLDEWQDQFGLYDGENDDDDGNGDIPIA